jgi:hypothetical protein
MRAYMLTPLPAYRDTPIITTPRGPNHTHASYHGRIKIDKDFPFYCSTRYCFLVSSLIALFLNRHGQYNFTVPRSE